MDASAAIAITGLSGYFPGATDVETFWGHLVAGRVLTEVRDRATLSAAGVPTRLLDDPQYIGARGTIEDAPFFDAAFFKLSPREASCLDPQQRLLLQCAWRAVEDAALDLRAIDRSVGVFAAASTQQYLQRLFFSGALDPHSLEALGTGVDFIASRISYALDLRGPSMVVKTACSSGLVAVHLACQSLNSGECDAALVGAATVAAPLGQGYLYRPGGVGSPDGICRPFDRAARGTVAGDGVGAVVLRRLDDALRDGDPIRAVILGSAVNNDGGRKIGPTAPSARGHATAIEEALAFADVDSQSIGYVEAHGAGTLLGDAIEVEALQSVFSTRAQPCFLGSVKGNIGHTDAAAGLIGLIKATLCLQNRLIVPTANFKTPASGIDPRRFEVCAEARPWRSKSPRRAGVCALGLGGTNAHAVLEEAPLLMDEKTTQKKYYLLPLSAKTTSALETVTSQVAAAIDTQSADAIAQTLQLGRHPLTHRRVVVGESTQAIKKQLEARTGTVATGSPEAPKKIILMIGGAGVDPRGYARDLYQENEVFRDALDQCAASLETRTNIRLFDVLWSSKKATNPLQALRRRANTASLDVPTAHAIIFSLLLASARAWQTFGVNPAALIGDSLGEVVAATISGVFEDADAIELIYERARLIERTAAGAMLAVPCAPEDLSELGEGLTLAAINAPKLCVVAGAEGDVDALDAALRARGIFSQRLVSTRAPHTPLMEPIRAELTALIENFDRRKPIIPFYSNVTGALIDDDEAMSAAYWASHLCSTVQLSRGLGEILEDDGVCLLEVSTSDHLSHLASATRRIDDAPLTTFPSAYSKRAEAEHFLLTLGRLWCKKIDIDWRALSPNIARRCSLPGYPFEGIRCWIDVEVDAPTRRRAPTAQRAAPSMAPASSGDEAPRGAVEKILASEWSRALGVDAIGRRADFFRLGGHSLLAVQLLHRIRAAHGIVITVRDLNEHPTIIDLARYLDDKKQARLALKKETLLALDIPERVDALTGHLVARFTDALALPVSAQDDLATYFIDGALAEIIEAVEMDFSLKLHPHELLGVSTLSALASDLARDIERYRPVQSPAPYHDALEKNLSAFSSTRVIQRVEGGEGEINRRAPVFILSSARSGSTLLRVMLTGHPDIFCPPELHLLMFQTMAARREGLPSRHFASGLSRALEGLGVERVEAARWVEAAENDAMTVEAVYDYLGELTAPSIFIDKSPSYAHDLATLERAEAMFENASYIFLTRHPAAVVESYVKQRLDRLAPLGALPDPFDRGEHHWVTHNLNICDFLSRVSAHRQHWVRYEDLVSSPEASLRSLCTFLSLPFDPAVLRPYEGQRMRDGAGDPRFHLHDGIDASLATAWQTASLPRTLTPTTCALADALSYGEH